MKLYTKAKQEPKFRFYMLYDKVYRSDILEFGYRLAKANGGEAGVDNETFAEIEERGLELWLKGIAEELRDRKYKPQPVRRVMMPKPGGGERPLGIPTIRDRVVQTAVKLVLEPIFEADFEDSAHGYRPGRSATDAVREVHKALCDGFTDVVDADLSKYFDTIPHRDLMYAVARRVTDRHMLALVKSWLKVPVEERDGRGNRRMTGGKKSKRGTPQGGVISPLLANIYINRMLRAWRERGKDREYRARIVAYADDFVVLSRGQAVQALQWVRWAVDNMGLSLNEAKTTVRDARQQHFDFLGYTFGPERYRKDGHWYLGAKPSKKSIARLRLKISELLVPANNLPFAEVRFRLNRVLRGWSQYFSYGTRYMAYRAVDHYVGERVRHFLRRRHKVQSRGTTRFGDDVIFGALGVLQLRTVHLGPAACARV